MLSLSQVMDQIKPNHGRFCHQITYGTFQDCPTFVCLFICCTQCHQCVWSVRPSFCSNKTGAPDPGTHSGPPQSPGGGVPPPAQHVNLPFSQVPPMFCHRSWMSGTFSASLGEKTPSVPSQISHRFSLFWLWSSLQQENLSQLITGHLQHRHSQVTPQGPRC